MAKQARKRRRSQFFRYLAVVSAIGFLLLVACVVSENTDPLTPDEVRTRDDEVNQASSVNIPHNFAGGKLRTEEPALTSKVEQDALLSESESSVYRSEYQQIIRLEQPMLRRIDRNLTVMEDVQMSRPNNVAGYGIAGSHDYHDESVRSNLYDLTKEVESAENPTSPSVTKIWSAILAYKDLSDTLSHLATVPNTKSTAYLPPVAPSIGYQGEGETILKHFKDAQFAPVDSNAYWTSIWQGLDGYDSLAMDVQVRLYRSLNPVERHLAGRWGSVQSLGPFLATRATPRRSRPPLNKITNSADGW